jgi:hypothetical protein
VIPPGLTRKSCHRVKPPAFPPPGTIYASITIISRVELTQSLATRLLTHQKKVAQSWSKDSVGEMPTKAVETTVSPQEIAHDWG